MSKRMKLTWLVGVLALVLVSACSADQGRTIYTDSATASNFGVCPGELGRIANDVQNQEEAKAAVRQYLQCRKDRRVAEPSMEDEVRGALERNPWPVIARDTGRIMAHFFDRDAIKKMPSYDELENWVQMVRDRKLLAEANGDVERAEALDLWILKGEFALGVKNTRLGAPK